MAVSSLTLLMYDATEEQKTNAKNQGDIFHNYIWGEKGICDYLKKLNSENYGTDLKLTLLQFYVNPIQYELENLKEIEPYRKEEKSIAIPIIVTNENFFNKSEMEREVLLKEYILQKIDLLAQVVKKKKLDTNVEVLKKDLQEILENRFL